MEQIGVIGLGRMGTAIAQRLSAQGHRVTGWTRSGRAAEGVPLAATLREVAEASDALVLSLLNDAAVAETLDALIENDLSGKIIIETSTVVPTLLKNRIPALVAAGCSAVDAPISGGPEMVAAGTCGVFIGGTDAEVVRAKAVIHGFAGRVFHVGPLGAGLVMKTINNAMLQTYFAGLRDMLPLAKRAGLSLETVIGIIAGGPAGTPMLQDRAPKILGQDIGVGFAISAANKDSDVFRRVAQSYGVPAPTLALAQAAWEQAIAAGLAELDIAAMLTHSFDQA